MSFRLISLILFSVSLSAVAQLMLKVGVERADVTGKVAETVPVFSKLLSMLVSPFVLLGLATYALGTIVWLFVLAKSPLSVAYPFVGAGFILTALLGAMVLNENLSALRICGIIMIAIGCALVARSA